MENHIHGGDVYRYKNVTDFSANCNPFGTPESVKRAVAEAMELVCHYPDVRCDELRDAIGDYEKIKPEYIICGNGAADLIFSLVLARKPKKALLPAPTFAEYAQALGSVGCEVIWYELAESAGFCMGEEFLDSINEDLDMIFLCNPNNPTGVLLSKEFLEKVLKRSRSANCLLVLDECFVDFVEEPELHTMKEYLEEYENLFILKAFTKRYAMAGVRLGYGMHTDKNLLRDMRRVTQPWNVSILAQKAGIAALKETRYVETSMAAIRRERKYMLREMEKAGYTTYSSMANYIFFKGPENLYEECLKRNLLIRDCSNYQGLSKGYYRVAVRLHEENARLLEVLADIRKEG